MNSSQMHKPITIKDVYLSAIGFDPLHAGSSVEHEDLLPLALEDEISKALKNWSGFCVDMADWYLDTFAEEPIILIGAPTIEMCVRYQIPARRGFIMRTLGRIIEEMGPESFVGIVDCKHDPLTDEGLATLANHWVHEFARIGHFPYTVPDQPDDLCISPMASNPAYQAVDSTAHSNTG